MMFQTEQRNESSERVFKAVDNVLDNIAPGQSQSIMPTLTTQNNKNDVADDIREATKAANGSNNNIQLLSLMCWKSEDSYEYSIIELMKIFPGLPSRECKSCFSWCSY